MFSEHKIIKSFGNMCHFGDAYSLRFPLFQARWIISLCFPWFLAEKRMKTLHHVTSFGFQNPVWLFGQIY